MVLADNLPAFNIELVREQVGDAKALDATLAQLVSIGLLRSEEVGNIRRTILLHKVYESVPIKLLLNEEEMALFAVHRYQFAGVDIRARLARHYPLREMGVHAIGYVSAINEQDMKQIDSAEYAGTSLIGKLGVEGAYEQQLHGKPGFREIEVNAAGRPVDKQGGYAAELQHPPAGGRRGFDPRVWMCACKRWPKRRWRASADRWWRSIRKPATSSRSPAPRDSIPTNSSAVCRSRSMRAVEQYRCAPAQSRIARRLSAGLDGEAAVRLGRPEIRNITPRNRRILPGVLYVAGQQQQVSRR